MDYRERDCRRVRSTSPEPFPATPAIVKDSWSRNRVVSRHEPEIEQNSEEVISRPKYGLIGLNSYERDASETHRTTVRATTANMDITAAIQVASTVSSLSTVSFCRNVRRCRRRTDVDAPPSPKKRDPIAACGRKVFGFGGRRIQLTQPKIDIKTTLTPKLNVVQTVT